MLENNTAPRITTHVLAALVNVTAGTRSIAKTRRAVLLEERGYAPRLYVPADDVAADTLVESGTRSHCPYKGDARYFDVVVAGRTLTDAAWSYAKPLPDMALIAGMIAFDHPAIQHDWRG